MQRYVVNDKLELDIKDKKHIINVMRMKIGECFQIINDNNLYTCKIIDIANKDPLYEIINKEELNSNKNYKIILACSLIKEQKWDYLLQKATELGVDEIIPLVTDRTVVKIDNKKDNKINRWNRIIKEAVEQSHKVKIPKLHDISTIKDLLNENFDLKILCNTNELSKNIKKVLQDSKKSDTIIIVVGPEGGFSKKEVKMFTENNFISTSLGENVLRAETVPLYVLSIINYEFMR